MRGGLLHAFLLHIWDGGEVGVCCFVLLFCCFCFFLFFFYFFHLSSTLIGQFAINKWRFDLIEGFVLFRSTFAINSPVCAPSADGESVRERPFEEREGEVSRLLPLCFF